MFPQYVCNLLATLRHPPWTEELNWNLHMTMEGEERIPFHSYVRPSGAPTCMPTCDDISSIPQFSALPAELQLRILSFCSASTLFQLMRVSSALRIEASKLFWGNVDAYFLTDAHWLMNGGHPGYTGCDLAFLPQVQNVEIEYHAGRDNEICPRHEDGIHVRHDLISEHWKSFKKRFTNAKRVIINQNWISPPWRNETEPVPQALRILAEACPPDVEAFALIIEEKRSDDASGSATATNKWQRSLYQHSGGGVWGRIETYKHHETVLMPLKRFYGPVGEFYGGRYEGERDTLQKWALWPLSLEGKYP